MNKKNMKAAIGRKLAARVLKTWNEDFVDEDTGEVVSIERNEMIMERETVLTEENIDDILESGSLLSFSTRMQRQLHATQSSSTHSLRTRLTLRRRRCSTSTVSSAMLTLLMTHQHARCSRIYSSLTSVTTSAR